MAHKFRRWLLKQLLGFDASQLVLFDRVLTLLAEELNELKVQLQITSRIVLEVKDMTGGPGWTIAMQNAIANLDTNISNVAEVVKMHHEAFTEYFEVIDAQEQEEDKDDATKQSKKHLN